MKMILSRIAVYGYVVLFTAYQVVLQKIHLTRPWLNIVFFYAVNIWFLVWLLVLWKARFESKRQEALLQAGIAIMIFASTDIVISKFTLSTSIYVYLSSYFMAALVTLVYIETK